jgi:hypothetical protein
MAGTLEASAELAESPSFQRKVRAAMVSAAKDVAAEAISQSDPTRSQQRRGLALNVFADVEKFTRVFAILVATNPVITTTSADGDLQFTVNSVWDAVAGVPPVVTP